MFAIVAAVLFVIALILDLAKADIGLASGTIVTAGLACLALHLAGANGTHAVSYCAEAGLFQEIGIPTVICGPGWLSQKVSST